VEHGAHTGEDANAAGRALELRHGEHNHTVGGLQSKDVPVRHGCIEVWPVDVEFSADLLVRPERL
jgi:hypothetical protein